MTGPVRLRLSRRKGFDLQAHSRAVNGLPAVNVARPSKWGNPYRIGDDVPGMPGQPMDTVDACHYFRLFTVPTLDLAPLRGRNLACWCAPGAPCHADILLELANPDLDTLVAHARHHTMTPEEIAAQRRSFARGMGPCEHGIHDFETCPQCREACDG